MIVPEGSRALTRSGWAPARLASRRRSLRPTRAAGRSDRRLALRDAIEPARQLALLELGDVQEVEAARQPLHQGAAEEVHDEAVGFVHVVAVARTGAEVRIGGRARRVDLQAARAQDAPHLGAQRLEPRRRQRHAVEHVRVAGVEARIRVGQRLPAIVLGGREHVLETGGARLLADGRDAARGEVERLDPQAAAREVETVAPLAGAELQQVTGAGPGGLQIYTVRSG